MTLPSNTAAMSPHNNLPFLLRNRELAGLILDHCDHQTIGTFRLLCKQADACAKGAFLLTSTHGFFSKRSTEAIASDLASWEGRMDLLKAKTTRWQTITFADFDGFVLFYKVFRVFGGPGGGILRNVKTVIVNSAFFNTLYRQSLWGDDGENYNLYKFRILATYLKPRNVCIGQLSRYEVYKELAKLMKTWPIENVAWHDACLPMVVYCTLFPNVPHHHYFYRVLKVPPKTFHTDYLLRIAGKTNVKSITFQGPVADSSRSWLPSWAKLGVKCGVNGVAKKVSVDGPGGLQYFFPAEYQPCPCCNDMCC